MKEIKDMSNDELRQYLNDIRLKRKTGYDRKPRSSQARNDTSKKFKDLDDDLATRILKQLEGRISS